MTSKKQETKVEVAEVKSICVQIGSKTYSFSIQSARSLYYALKAIFEPTYYTYTYPSIPLYYTTSSSGTAEKPDVAVISNSNNQYSYTGDTLKVKLEG